MRPQACCNCLKRAICDILLILNCRAVRAPTLHVHAQQVLVTGEGDVLNTVLQILRASVPAALGTDAYEQYQLPYVPEVILSVTAARKLIKARPPSGLIELGRRDMRIRQVRQALQVSYYDSQPWLRADEELLQLSFLFRGSAALCLLQDFWAAHTDHQGRMPTKARLLQAGYKDLVHAIEADGFLEVAQLLNMTGSRKPNGFWDNLEVLDEVRIMPVGTICLVQALNLRHASRVSH